MALIDPNREGPVSWAASNIELALVVIVNDSGVGHVARKECYSNRSCEGKDFVGSNGPTCIVELGINQTLQVEHKIFGVDGALMLTITSLIACWLALRTDIVAGSSLGFIHALTALHHSYSDS